jgi:hypothetical protein
MRIEFGLWWHGLRVSPPWRDRGAARAPRVGQVHCGLAACRHETSDVGAKETAVEFWVVVGLWNAMADVAVPGRGDVIVGARS